MDMEVEKQGMDKANWAKCGTSGKYRL